MTTAYLPEQRELPTLEEDPTLADAPAIGRWYPPIFTGEATRVQITPRMADMLVGIMRGESNKQIGHRLFLTEDTVKTHVRRLFAKFGAVDRAHAAALFLTGQVEVYIGGSPGGRPARRPASTRMLRLDEVDEL